jgi:ribonuclease P protein subunit POP4
MAPITPGNFLKHEFIGLHVKVSASSDPKLVGMKGAVVDETKKMLCIHDGRRSRMFSKEISTFQFRLPDGKIVLVEGKHMVGQPENRLKMRTRSW